VRHLVRFHQALARYGCYPLMLSSMLACATLVVRVVFSQTVGYAHMVWNLFLAWIPFVCSILMAWQARRAPRQWWRVLPLGAVWLLFLPNAPYLVTDIGHIRHIDSFSLWYDTVLVAAFAWTGCFLAAASLHIVHGIVRESVGAAGGWLVVGATAMLSGLGVYLGRFRRWNSWDVLTHPAGIVRDIVGTVADPRQLVVVVATTCLFAALTLVCYVMFCFIAYSSPVPHTYPSTHAPRGRWHPPR
jgi:uncharacterized membrane protein